jgi:hypothetical protein|tara:strand:- start:1476 stop:1946 length:471 start_codon:yes stop_codon:yes gene_type:complete
MNDVPSDNLNIAIDVRCPVTTETFEKCRGELWLDDTKLESFTIESDSKKTISANVPVTDGDHILKVKHTYSPEQKEALIIEEITLDDIRTGVIAYQGEYRPLYPEPWYSDECAEGRKPKEVIGRGEHGSGPCWMGWEGEYTLKISIPLYEWLLEYL